MRSRYPSFVLALAATLAVASPAVAQVTSSRTVTLLVGYGAGTGIDTVARFYAEKLHEATGQAFVVVNKVGAYGNLAAGEVARAKPDGYTLLITPNTPITVNMHLMKMPFDPEKDLVPIAPLTRWGLVLLVNPQRTPVNNVQELTALIRQSPGKLNYASGNFAGRAGAELYRISQGLDAVHVPYKSVPLAVSDLMGGQVDFMFSDVVAGLPHVKSGRLRALGVTTPARVSAAPDIPTLKEAGVRDVEIVSWFAVFGPSGMPAGEVERLEKLFNGITHSEAARAYFAGIGAEPFIGAQRDMPAFISQESRRWGDLVKAAKIE